MLLKYKKIEKRKAERNEQLASKKVKSSFLKGHKFSKCKRALKMSSSTESYIHQG